MQLHFSPSMRSITISSSNGFIDLMKIKVAARHFSYRTLFHTILILAFLLPFVFILTAVVTLEGVNKCSSFGTLFYRLFIHLHYQFLGLFVYVFGLVAFYVIDLGVNWDFLICPCGDYL
jgi:hypothetical protein